jgi:hypothetical protein
MGIFAASGVQYVERSEKGEQGFYGCQAIFAVQQKDMAELNQKDV